MKTKAIHLTLALVAVTGATAQPDQRPEGRRPPPVPPLLALFDTDRDGTISAEEIQNASASLAKLDRNGDGKITRDEMRPPRPDGEGPPPDGAGPQGPRPPRGEGNPNRRRPGGPPPEGGPDAGPE